MTTTMSHSNSKDIVILATICSDMLAGKKKLIILFLGEVQSAQVKVKASFCLGEESIQTKRVIREHKLRS